MPDIPETDHEFEEVAISRVESQSGGWSIDRADGWSFFVPDTSPVEPRVGMVARFYGRGIGYAVRGLTLDGTIAFYKTPEEQAEEDRKRSEDYKAERAIVATQPKNPEQQIEGFEWTDDMGEVSGFGGGYEATCRAMVSAGCKWLSEHPDADPKFHGYKGVTGICMEDNDDAKALTSAVLAPANGEATGAMHQAAISHALHWRRLGSWIAYQREMRELKRSDPD